VNWGYPERGKVLLFGGDLIMAAAAAVFAGNFHPVLPSASTQPAGRIVLFVLVFPACFYICDLYDLSPIDGARTFVRLLAAFVVSTCIIGVFLLFFQWQGFSRVGIGISVALFFLLSFSCRSFYKHNRSRFANRRGVLLIGKERDAAALQAMMKSTSCPYEFTGILRTSSRREPIVLSSVVEPLVAVATAAGGSYHVVGTTRVEEIASSSGAEQFPENPEAEGFSFHDYGIANSQKLEQLALNCGVDTIVVSPDFSTVELAESLMRLRFQGIRISTLPDFCSQILEKLPLETLNDSWFSFASGFHLLHKRIFRKVKRLMDILLACVGLIVTLPISLLAAMVIKIESPGPVLFKQWRVGRREQPFLLIKFRSMRLDAESDGQARWATAQDPRVTFVGRILRKLHIDEIPQMINVLLGQMSFVGPRPERPVFVEQFKTQVPFYHLRHYLPPGITGWAQVNYPYGDCMEDAKNKLQYDLYYVRNASLTLDLRILLRTARVILFRTGSR